MSLNMNIDPLIDISRELIRYQERRLILLTNIGDGWYNEAGVERAKKNIARYEAQIQNCIEQLRGILNEGGV